MTPRELAMRDQAFTSLKKHRAEIKKIVDTGVHSERDQTICRSVCALIYGDILNSDDQLGNEGTVATNVDDKVDIHCVYREDNRVPGGRILTGPFRNEKAAFDWAMKKYGDVGGWKVIPLGSDI